MDPVGVAMGVIFLTLALLRIIDKRHRSPVPPFVGRFLDSTLRRWVQSPDTVIRRSGVEQGMTVLDLGCGSGALTALLARAVGEQGKVYAADLQAGMLDQLKRKLSRVENLDISNVEMILANAYELPFENDSFDMVFMVASLQEIFDRGRALREARRVLKSSGILAVSELLPDTDYPLRSTTIRLVQQEGFVLDGNSGNFWNYTLRFSKRPLERSSVTIPS